jgi:predicted TIM-barrel fold metal-dependent hydrolase
MRLNECGCCAPRNLSRRAFLASGAAALAAPHVGHAQAPHRVDVHHHIFPRAVMDLQERLNPKWGKLETPRGLPQWTPRMMLDDMEKNGLASVVISPAGPGAWYGDVSGARQICRAWNEYAASLKRDHGKRVGVFALVALPDVEGSLREIEYALDTLKLDGVAFYSSYDQKYPGDEKYAAIWAELDRRKAIVFFHPVACCGPLVPGLPTNAYELPFDTTRAIASLLFSGVFSRHSNIRFIFSHAGGAMPMLAGRLDDNTKTMKALRDKAPEGVPALLRTLRVDTAGAFFPGALAATRQMLPDSNILYGSDFPYSSSSEAVAGLAANGLPDAALAGIEGANAYALFPHLKA